MTIRVDAYVINPETGKMETLDSEPGEHLAGIEDNRYNFWGSDIMSELGLSLILTIRERTLNVKGDELNKLEAELRIILSNLDTVLLRVPYDESFIRQRTGNVLLAIEKARKCNGGVVIW